MPPEKSSQKIGIIGAGSVGATIAYAAMIRGVGRHIVLFDIARNKVDAEVLDLNHGLLFAPQATVDGSDDVEILRDADVIVMTAGARPAWILPAPTPPSAQRFSLTSSAWHPKRRCCWSPIPWT